MINCQRIFSLIFTSIPRIFYNAIILFQSLDISLVTNLRSLVGILIRQGHLKEIVLSKFEQLPL